MPLLLLAVAMIPLLIVPLVVELPTAIDSAIVAADWVIWAVFAVEYGVRLTLTDQRWRFVRREWSSLLIIILPFLRPLRLVRSARALRVLRLFRFVGVVGAIGKNAQRLLARHKLHYALLITGVVVLGAAALVLAVEEGSGSINTFGDALWWAVTTVTTVGYGDKYPVTPAGRGVAAALMLAGITLFGVLTANLAAFMLERDGEEPGEAGPTDSERLIEVLARLEHIERQLTAQPAHCPACGTGIGKGAG